MIRVVIDTNTLVSALLQPVGLPAAVFMLALFLVMCSFANPMQSFPNMMK